MMTKLKRTIPPKNIEIFVNYYDRNKAQRWGKLFREHKNHVIVVDIFEEKIKVKKEKIIKMQEKA